MFLYFNFADRMLVELSDAYRRTVGPHHPQSRKEKAHALRAPMFVDLLLQLVAAVRLRLAENERLARVNFVLLRFDMRLNWRRGLSKRNSDERP
jgi:hypothetical protein